MKIKIYTDGACSGNPEKVDGHIILINKKQLTLSGGEQHNK